MRLIYTLLVMLVFSQAHASQQNEVIYDGQPGTGQNYDSVNAFYRAIPSLEKATIIDQDTIAKVTRALNGQSFGLSRQISEKFMKEQGILKAIIALAKKTDLSEDAIYQKMMPNGSLPNTMSQSNILATEIHRFIITNIYLFTREFRTNLVGAREQQKINALTSLQDFKQDLSKLYKNNIPQDISTIINSAIDGLKVVNDCAGYITQKSNELKDAIDKVDSNDWRKAKIVYPLKIYEGLNFSGNYDQKVEEFAKKYAQIYAYNNRFSTMKKANRNIEADIKTSLTKFKGLQGKIMAANLMVFPKPIKNKVSHYFKNKDFRGLVKSSPEFRKHFGDPLKDITWMNCDDFNFFLDKKTDNNKPLLQHLLNELNVLEHSLEKDNDDMKPNALHRKISSLIWDKSENFIESQERRWNSSMKSLRKDLEEHPELQHEYLNILSKISNMAEYFNIIPMITIKLSDNVDDDSLDLNETDLLFLNCENNKTSGFAVKIDQQHEGYAKPGLLDKYNIVGLECDFINSPPHHCLQLIKDINAIEILKFSCHQHSDFIDTPEIKEILVTGPVNDPNLVKFNPEKIIFDLRILSLFKNEKDVQTIISYTSPYLAKADNLVINVNSKDYVQALPNLLKVINLTKNKKTEHIKINYMPKSNNLSDNDQAIEDEMLVCIKLFAEVKKLKLDFKIAFNTINCKVQSKLHSTFLADKERFINNVKQCAQDNNIEISITQRGEDEWREATFLITLS